MSTVHKITITQGKLNEINEFLNGYWEKDVWDFSDDIFTQYKFDGRDVTGKLDFSPMNNPIKDEAKYFILSSIIAREISLKTLKYNYNKAINHLAEFLAKYYPALTSFAVINHNKASIKWRTYLVGKGYKLNKNGGLTNIVLNSLFNKLYKSLYDFYDERDEFEKDKWDIRKIAPSKMTISTGKYTLNFNRIPNPFRDTIKNYLKVNVGRYSFLYCENMVIKLADFLKYINQKYPNWTSFNELSRQDIEGFISWYMPQTKETKHKMKETLLQMRRFLEYIQIAEYPEAPTKPVTMLIYKEDLPKQPIFDTSTIKYIPEEIIAQLDEKLEYLEPEEYIPIIVVLRATGMRIIDVLSLRYDNCLEKTQNGWYLVADISKTLVKHHRVPITSEIAEIIKKQINITTQLSQQINNPTKYLFIRERGPRLGLPPSARSVSRALNRLAADKNITDNNGEIFHFKNHSFRHTKGVELVNNGMNLLHVQKWMAHVSPEMTLRYAKILDNTMRKSWEDVMKAGIFKIDNSTGQLEKVKINDIKNQDLIEWEYIRHNLDAVRIPLGFCLKPSKIQCNHQFNPCLVCNNMCTSPEFLQEFEDEIRETKKQIERAKALGRIMWIEKNQSVLERLEAIAITLRDGKIYHKAGKKRREYIGEERINGK